MGAIEDRLWQDLVQANLPQGEDSPFPKGAQQQLARALQEWAARCIEEHLLQVCPTPEVFRKPDWKVNHAGRKFFGGVREQEVDVWLANSRAGLALAVDPKHFQSKDSLRKNWQNGHNDLVAFASNLHERFPMCAVAGIIAFPDHAAEESTLNQMDAICSRSVPREKPSNAYGKFEAFALVAYHSNGALTFPFTHKCLEAGRAFAALAEKLVTRTLGLL
ncbi:MAG: hypothetical protein FJ290_27500 [Planctomycetes bacterium]|nr:hypothetical protein [Planctomycetota bacterium]